MNRFAKPRIHRRRIGGGWTDSATEERITLSRGALSRFCHPVAGLEVFL